jgi:hypothetical protein
MENEIKRTPGMIFRASKKTGYEFYVAGSGLTAGTQVEAYLNQVVNNPPLHIYKVNPNGTWAGLVIIPSFVVTGKHHLWMKDKHTGQLEKAHFLRRIGQYDNKPGKPVIYTAALDPLYVLINMVKPDFEFGDFKRLEFYAQCIGEAFHFLPDYLKMSLAKSSRAISKLHWNVIAGTFLNFLLGLIIFGNLEEEFNAKLGTKAMNDIYSDSEKTSERFFSPMKEALSKLPKEFFNEISNEDYVDDVKLVAEIANRILWGPKYEFMNKTIRFAIRTKLGLLDDSSFF